MNVLVDLLDGLMADLLDVAMAVVLVDLLGVGMGTYYMSVGISFVLECLRNVPNSLQSFHSFDLV